MKKSESSKRKHNTGISANLANGLTTVGSILEFLNLENELRDKMHEQETMQEDGEVFCYMICRMLEEIRPSDEDDILEISLQHAIMIFFPQKPFFYVEHKMVFHKVNKPTSCPVHLQLPLVTMSLDCHRSSYKPAKLYASE